MTIHECGISSLFELIILIIFIGAFSVGIAYTWILLLDEMYYQGDLDLTELH